MKLYAVRTLHELGPSVTLAPERYRPVDEPRGVPLSEIAVEVRTRLAPEHGERALILDTTHVREGVISLPMPSESAGKGKTRVPVGALLISRLRPYLRQVGFVSASLLARRAHPPLACSTEFAVLVARDEDESLAFLLPFLLSAEVQARLAARQEGGHRPRVPRVTLMALRVPPSRMQCRRETSASVEAALAALYDAKLRLGKALG
jgi:hypothetical protein